MELVESYLTEVGRFLPQADREHLVNELRDDILNEIDGRMEATGSSDSDQVEREVLAGFGHPIKMANRYQPPKYIIGPELYPVFMHTLKSVFGLVVVLQVVVGFVLAAANDWQIGPFELFDMSINLLIWAFLVVIGVFIAIQFSSERIDWYDRWQPEQLASGGLGVIDRSDVITNLLSEGFFLLWFNNVVVLANFVPTESAEFFVTLAPIWTNLAWSLNVVFAGLFIVHAFVLMRGVWQRTTLILEIVGCTALIALIISLLMSPELVIINAELDENVLRHIHRTLQFTLLVIAGFTLWDIWLAFKHFYGSSFGLKKAA